MTHPKKLLAKETWKAAVKKPKAKDWTEVASSTVVDIGSAVVGGYGGSFLGKWAVPAGIAVCAVGHSFGQRWLSALGIGVIASPFNNNSTARTVNPNGQTLKDAIEAGKARGKDYIEMLKEKFFINKIMGNSQSTQSTSQTTDATTTDTTDTTTPVSGLDTTVDKATLDDLTNVDQQITSEAVEYQAKNNVPPDAGNSSPMNGMDVDLDKLPHII